MPKMKSKGAVKKRFRLTKTGRAKCSKPGRGHMHCSYDGNAHRGLRKPIILDQVWSTLIRRMMGV